MASKCENHEHPCGYHSKLPKTFQSSPSLPVTQRPPGQHRETRRWDKILCNYGDIMFDIPLFCGIFGRYNVAYLNSMYISHICIQPNHGSPPSWPWLFPLLTPSGCGATCALQSPVSSGSPSPPWTLQHFERAMPSWQVLIPPWTGAPYDVLCRHVFLTFSEQCFSTSTFTTVAV